MAGHSREELKAIIKAGKELVVNFYHTPISVRQQITTADRGVRGARWVSRVTFPAPTEDDARQLLLTAINDLGDGSEKFTVPELAEVPAQWTAYRHGVSGDAPEPDVTEQEKYESLTASCKNDITILYMYGGAHTTNGPASRRAVAAQLSKSTGGRCIIIEPRLAPQHAFPTQQLDALHAYLSLLYPPPGAFHAPVDPKKLVLAGDSSGAKLALTLVLTILAARRHSSAPNSPPTLRFNGRTVPLPLPAGVTMQSPALDMLGLCLPNFASQSAHDIFEDIAPGSIPSDDLWPTNPPRLHMAAELDTLTHPLLTPIAAAEWTGAPPMYIAIGSAEVCLDGARVVARLAARNRVPVVYEEYELMPHNWPMLLKGWPLSDRCMENWAKACVRFASGEEVGAEGCFVPFDADSSGERVARPVDVYGLTEWDTEEVRRMVKESVARWGERAGAALEWWKPKL